MLLLHKKQKRFIIIVKRNLLHNIDIVKILQDPGREIAGDHFFS